MTTVNIQQLEQFRKALHANPEVSGQEKETSKRVLHFLESCHPDEILSGVGGYGIIASWDSGLKGPEVLFRAELDALPIAEVNDFSHKSQYPGVSHKCGHDGHAAILCGLARHLSEHKPVKGKVRLLFQPAEENGEGARAMLADKKFAAIQPDYVFALHNLPEFPLHAVVVKSAIFTAAVNSMIIRLEGKTAHAAEPEHGINPALAVAQILTESQKLDYNNPKQEAMRVITPVCVELGEKAYGVAAGKAAIHLTLRCWNDHNLRRLESEISKLAAGIAKHYGLKMELEYAQTFTANYNDPSATDLVRKAAASVGAAVVERTFPFKWGEDFGAFTSRFKGCMFGLGAGENTPSLHNPDYDFPDPLLETGVRIFSEIMDAIANPDYV